MPVSVDAPVAPTRTLQELILATHFRAPLPLTVLDLADWVGAFSDFPIIQELQPLPVSNMPAPGAPQFSFEIHPVGTLPRMLLRTGDGRSSIQLQADRFAMGWSRIEPLGDLADYPGFEIMLQRWSQLLSRFEAWTTQRFHLRSEHRLVEVNYANASPLNQHGQQKRISEIFKFVHTTGRPVNVFNTTWTESVYPPAEGRLTGIVTAMVALGNAPPDIPVVAFNFTGMAEVAEGHESKHIMNDLHAKIREMYQSAIVSDAA
jgi:uncharacterized protein (TIGR04255 family)